MRWAASARHPTLNLWVYYSHVAGLELEPVWTTAFDYIKWFNSPEEARRVKHHYMVICPATEDEVKERCVQQEIAGETPRVFPSL